MVAISLILFTTLVTMATWYAFPDLHFHGRLWPHETWYRRRWHQLITSGFLHADASHLILNMIALLFFGPYLEQAIGGPSLLALYLSALAVSNMPTLCMERNNPRYSSLGASGAVEAVLFGFITMFPLDHLEIFFLPFGIPAIYFGIFFLAMSYYEARRRRNNINHVAHITGALYGIAYVLLFVPGSISRILGYFGW
jgi:membrane associated rhomboid family serine protease